MQEKKTSGLFAWGGDMDSLSPEEQRQLQRTRQKMTIGVLLLAIVITLVWGWFHPSGTARMQWSETDLTLIMGENNVSTIPFTEITDLRLLHQYDYGEAVDGREDRGNLIGRWKNTELGEYSLNVNQRNEAAILIQTEIASWIFNMDNQETTEALYDNMLRTLQEEGYLQEQ